MINSVFAFSPDDERHSRYAAAQAVVAHLEDLRTVRVSINREADACAWVDVREPALSHPKGSHSADHRRGEQTDLGPGSLVMTRFNGVTIRAASDTLPLKSAHGRGDVLHSRRPLALAA
jgi:hypothetical protein